MRQSVIAAVIVGSLLSVPGAAWAGDPGEEAKLRAEVEQLRRQIDRLERRLSDVESRRPVAAAAGTTGELPPILEAAKNLQIHGSVDTSYTYNFNEPSDNTNSFRTFDTDHNSVMINNVELSIEKPVSAESPVGFRFDPTWGEDSQVFDAAGLGSGTDEFDLQQAYVQAYLPWGTGWDAKFGKFVTMHGAEVIESKDNWNFSRSILFGYAIPFTHTGLRVHSTLMEGLDFYAGINNGWDVVKDTNKAKTLEFNLTYAPMERASISSTFMFGAEQANDNRDQRFLYDLVAAYQPLDNLWLKFNYDYGFDQDGAVEDSKDATWQGLAGYAKYQVNDWYSLAARAEYFFDNDGIRTGQRTASVFPSNDVDWWEMTLTNEFKLYKDLIARLEYRHDWADGRIFRRHQGGTANNTQNTIAVEFLYPF
ncbi:MAG: porin [Candidatus Omnitrophica bacterium]|nr:porin [Candidatus Omnitrophota bacterium]